jgi:hypothetical protein
LAYLADVRERVKGPEERLEAVLEAYALVSAETGSRHSGELAALLHREAHVAVAHQHLRGMVRDVLIEGLQAGRVRDDVVPEELASYCVHALSAAADMPSKAAVRRLVAVTLSGLRPVH